MPEVAGKSGDSPEGLTALPDMRLEQFFLATLRRHVYLDGNVAADQLDTPYTAWERVSHIAWCVGINNAGGHYYRNSSGSRSSRPSGKECYGA